MAKIAILEIEEWEKEYVTNALQRSNIFFSELPLELGREFPPDLYDAEILSCFIYSQLTPENLAKFPHLLYIVTRSTGVDHIALDYCREKGIVVSNVPKYGVHGVAEHAFALILTLAKKIIPSVEQTRKGDFSTKGLTGSELYGKTLGIIGVGKIGTSVATIAKGFGMNILATSHHVDEDVEKIGVTFVSLETLLASADVISLHVPLTNETKHMINMGNVGICKKGSLLINTARGGLIETEAILKGIEEGIFSGVGLDVLEEECNIKEERELLSKEFKRTCDVRTQLMDHMLLNREEVIITPHNAFNTKESLEEILSTTVENILSFEKGVLENVVKV